MAYNRLQLLRLEKQILKILSHTLLTEVADQSLRLTTFTTAKLTNDHSQVKVFVDVLDRNQADSIVIKLNKISGLFRTALAKKLKLYKSPKVLFVNDFVIDQASELEKLIAQEMKKIKPE